jgi:hypothetical protein
MPTWNVEGSGYGSCMCWHEAELWRGLGPWKWRLESTGVARL